MSKRDFDTLVEATNDLIGRGFTENFKAEDKFIVALNSKATYKPADLRITETYRFEGKSNPADSVELFAIVGEDGTKGTLVLSYGAKHSQNEDLIRAIRFSE